MNTLTLNHPPTQNSTYSFGSARREIRYNDGYIDTAGLGINSTWDVWDLEYQDTNDQIIIFRDFLKTNNGSTFNWTAPNESTAKNWICDLQTDPQITWGVNASTMKFKLIQVF